MCTVVEDFILSLDRRCNSEVLFFQEYQKVEPNIKGLQRLANYSLLSFREELVRRTCEKYFRIGRILKSTSLQKLPTKRFDRFQHGRHTSIFKDKMQL